MKLSDYDKNTIYKDNITSFCIVLGIVAGITFLFMWFFDLGMERVIPGPYAIVFSVTATVMLVLYFSLDCQEEIRGKEVREEYEEATRKLHEEEAKHERTRGFIKQFVPQDEVSAFLTNMETNRSQFMDRFTELLKEGSGDVGRTSDAGADYLKKVELARRAVKDIEKEIEAASASARSQGFEATSRRETAEDAHLATANG